MATGFSTKFASTTYTNEFVHNLRRVYQCDWNEGTTKPPNYRYLGIQYKSLEALKEDEVYNVEINADITKGWDMSVMERQTPIGRAIGVLSFPTMEAAVEWAKQSPGEKQGIVEPPPSNKGENNQHGTDQFSLRTSLIDGNG
jgi:hypothetical protein